MDHPSKFSAQNGKLKSSEFYPNKMMYLGVYVWAPTETLVKNELKQLTMAKTREWAAVWRMLLGTQMLLNLTSLVAS